MYRNEDLRRAIASLPCMECGLEGQSQHAHGNSLVWGKGRGIKSHDWAAFPLCADQPGKIGCHTKHDQRMDSMNKSERIDHEAMLIAKTFGMLMERGLLEVK